MLLLLLRRICLRAVERADDAGSHGLADVEGVADGQHRVAHLQRTHVAQRDHGQATRLTTGVFNLTGPAQPLTIGGLLDTARSTLDPAAQLQWVDEKFLLDAGVAPWSDLPVWLPRAQAALHGVDIARALASGLQCRPLADTLSDIALWPQDRVPPPADPAAPPRPPAGRAPERDAALLQAWRARLAR